MEAFCAAVSDGYTIPPIPFRYVGERRDFDFEHVARPSERPQVTLEFEHLILDEPITCRVVSLVDWRRRPELDGKEERAYDAVYSVDAGTAHGLAVGMHLFVEGVRSGRFDGRIELAGPESAHFQILAFESQREWAEGLIGRTASTRHPRALPR